MIRRFFAWLSRRQAAAHRADDIIRESRATLRRVESIVSEQEQGRVNFLYDRMTGNRRRA